VGGGGVVADVSVVLTVLNIYTNITRELMPINMQQDATVHKFTLSVNCST